MRSTQIACVILAVLLVAPSLTTGLSADDHIQQILLGGAAPASRTLDGLEPRRFDLFNFADGDPARNHKLMDDGVFPWWADPHVRLAFFRPISAATHILDQALFGRSPIAKHADNLFWFAVALSTMALFYRRFFGADKKALAGFAIFLYALDDAHGPAVGWIANRNAMVALALAIPVLILHDRWRRDGTRWAASASAMLFLLALLAGESAIAVLGYLAAYALVLDRASLRWRCFSLVPYLAVAACWRVGYRLLGYGASGSGVYLDPGSDPMGFLHVLPRRFIWLLDGQLAFPWSDFADGYQFVSHRLSLTMFSIAIVTLIVLAVIFAPVLRRDRLARFFALGMVLSALPSCATFAADRLLWFVGIGAMGLIAQTIAYATKEGRALRIAAVFLIAIHVVLAPPLLALRSRSMDTVEIPLGRANNSLPQSADIADKTIVLVNPPSDLFAGYLAFTRASEGEPQPRRIRWLSTGTDGVEIERTGPRTLRIRPQDGYLKALSETMLRSPRHPLLLGEKVELTGLTITITALTPDSRPAEAQFDFDRPLEDPSLYWARWDRLRYVPFVLPKVGERITLGPIDLLDALFNPSRS